MDEMEGVGRQLQPAVVARSNRKTLAAAAASSPVRLVALQQAKTGWFPLRLLPGWRLAPAVGARSSGEAREVARSGAEL
jgi:hypothetical protein